MTSTRKYEIALSFAGEDREYVEMVADQLRNKGVKVFYDRYVETDLWGSDLYTQLVDVYMKQAQYTLMFISAHYLQKLWTNHERRAAQARDIEEAREYILPARFDDTEVPGILPTTGFIDLRRLAPVDVALMVCEKLGRTASSHKANVLASPKSPAICSEVAFDYRSHDGRFRIGADRAEFETKWSSASGNSIHCYNDPPTLRGVALAAHAKTVSEIGDASGLDWTSRSRTPSTGQFVVLQNINGFYAALKILAINYENELKFSYWILADGSTDFSTSSDP